MGGAEDISPSSFRLLQMDVNPLPKTQIQLTSQFLTCSDPQKVSIFSFWISLYLQKILSNLGLLGG